ATLQRMNPLRMPRPVGQEECRLAEVSHPARLLRVLTRDSAGVAKSLGRQVVAETDGAVFLSLPVQTADQREETLGKLVSLGIKKDAACEIRVALQENAERPLKF